MAGPDFRSDGRIEEARIEDVAPTVLHLLGCAIPDDMDGRVLIEALREPHASRPVRLAASVSKDDSEAAAVYTEKEAAEVEERLRALGYL